ncbi:MAG: hypothetical protein L3J29_05565 [Cyclobacteriaceae bacterium]|nr:hypothetical protein [Cyclobacteriaceae bacterium]
MKSTFLKNAQILILSLVMLIPTLNVQAQDKQYKTRLSVDYFNVIGTSPYLEIASKFKGENGYEPSTMLDLNVYREVTEDSLVLVGAIKTNHKGVARYELKDSSADVDTLVKHTYVIKIEDSKRFKNAKKAISYLDASIHAEIVEVDSVYSIKAILTDGLGDPISGEKLKINIQRMFAPLAIGRSYKTKGKGNVLVPLEESFSGVEGKLTFEVFLESKKYGTVKYLLNTDIGTPIVDLSTYDQRTMWSPPSKTPWFLLIFPNLLLLGIWGVIFLLVRNLYKIYKS